MNAIRNKVQLIGNLGANPELREFKSGKKMARISLATTDVHKDAEGKKISNTQWHNLVTCGKLAEIATAHLRKGSQIAVEGKLTYRTYENKDGDRQYFTEIVVSDLVMLQSNRS